MTEIAVQFRRAPLALFSRAGVRQVDPNVLAIRVQPDEGILLRFGAKVPGQGLQIRTVNMDFRYGSSFAVDSPDAYETLLLDAMVGDASLFTRDDEVERAWAILEPILDAWGAGEGGPLHFYAAGTWGPPGRRRAARARRARVAPAMTEPESAARGAGGPSAPHAVRRAESLATPMWEERGTTVRAVAGHLASLWDAPAAAGRGGRPPMVTEKGLPARPGLGPQPHRHGRRRRGRRPRGRTLLGPGRAPPVARDRARARARHRRAPIDARISTHCHDGADGGERVCYEEVVLTVRGEAAAHLAGIVAPLLIHDLPTHVWWPGDPPFHDPVFDQLVELGDRVLVDSADFSDLLGGLRRAGGPAPAQRRRRPELGAAGVVAGADGAVLRRASLPPLPARTSAGCGCATPSRCAHRRGTTRTTGRSAPGVAAPMAQALLYAGWIATRLGWRRHRTVEPLRDGGFRLDSRGQARDGRPR